MEKITMLGISGSGKTCFIYAMYDFMQKNRDGFTFITKNPDVDLELADGWDSIALDGIWPNGTVNTTLYDLTVLFRANPIMDFSWCDYRGSAIMDRSTESDVQDLHKRMLESQCLIICIGADSIKDILNGNDQKERELRRLNGLIAHFAANNRRRIPIIFALTKADLYSAAEQPRLLGVIQEYFSSLYSEGSGWLHAVVPVSLGNFKTGSGNIVNGVVSPKNIHIPVMFFMHSILRERINTIKDKLNGIYTNRSNYRAEIDYNHGRSWWDKLWNGDNSGDLSNRIANLDEEEKNITKNLEAVKSTVSSVGDNIS